MMMMDGEVVLADMLPKREMNATASSSSTLLVVLMCGVAPDRRTKAASISPILLLSIAGQDTNPLLLPLGPEESCRK